MARRRPTRLLGLLSGTAWPVSCRGPCVHPRSRIDLVRGAVVEWRRRGCLPIGTRTRSARRGSELPFGSGTLLAFSPFGNDSTVERGYGDTLGKHYEMDTAMKQDREMAEALRGIINSGFNRSGGRLSPAPSVLPTWSD